MKSTDILKIIVVHHQKTLPSILRTIPTSHVSNIKDHVLELHKVITTLVAYTLVKAQEDTDANTRTIVSGTISPELAKTLASQPNPINIAPTGPTQVKTVIVGTELPLPGEANIAQGGLIETDTDPEPATQIQILTKRDGSTVVVPPLGSKAPKKIFAPGMAVDATYISKIDNPDAE